MSDSDAPRDHGPRGPQGRGRVPDPGSGPPARSDGDPAGGPRRGGDPADGPRGGAEPSRSGPADPGGDEPELRRPTEGEGARPGEDGQEPEVPRPPGPFDDPSDGGGLDLQDQDQETDPEAEDSLGLDPADFAELAPEADRLYLSFRARARDPESEFAAFLAEHGEHAERLRFLHEHWQELGQILGKLGGDNLADQIRAFAEYTQTLSSFGEAIHFDPAAVERLRQEGFADRYEVVREIHRSRLSVLLEVYDRRLRRPCAMKVLRPREEGQGDTHQFVHMAEALITAQLEHPAIVPIQDVGFDEAGRLCFVMKLIRGRTFEHVIEAVHQRRDGWTLHKALRTLLRICDALEYAHSHGVSHQDIKPANLMVGRWGEAYLMDWGLHTRHDKAAELLEADDDLRVGGAALGVGPRGTPLYMSPEQARQQHDLTGPASDVYSMGGVLYHLIAGRPAYLEPDEQPTLWEIVRKVACFPPRPLAEVAPRAPAELVAVCERAMQREIRDRYASTTELREALAQFLEDEAEERQEALRQARRARASNQMLMDILAFGQVDLSGSREFTVRQAMDAAARRLRESPPPALSDRADLALALGDLYAHCGQVETALEFLTLAHRLVLEQHGPRHPNALEAAAALAWARYMDGQLDQARDELQAIHAVQVEELGRLAPDTLHTLWRLAQVLQRCGADLAVVQAHYRQVRDGYTEVDGPDSMGALNAISGWARVLAERGQPEEALPHLERAVEGMVRVHGENHSSTLIQQNDLAKAYLESGRLAQAEALFRHVLGRQEALLEEGHPYTETTRNNLAMALLKRRDPAALEVLERALQVKRRLLGPRHPEVRIQVHNLGVAHLDLGDARRARRLLEHCVWVQDKLGVSNRLTGRALYNLARAVLRGQEPELARDLARRARRVLEEQMEAGSRWLQDVDELLDELDGDGGPGPTPPADGPRRGPAGDRGPQPPAADGEDRDDQQPPRLRASG